MKTIGIIAEYNPFHNGHAYQIAHVKKTLGADCAVIAMSGDFVQRGAPAVLDKYTRAQMALSCGADLVFELPLCWSVSSAEDFAMAGITLLDCLGVVDGVCFGAETDNLPLLTEAAFILSDEPAAYRSLLSSYLKKGAAFPSARMQALTEYLSAADMSIDISKLAPLLCAPNNILALEYLKAIQKRHSALKPFLLPRQGAGYHDPCIVQTEHGGCTASATAVRQMLPKTPGETLPAKLSAVLPPASFSLLAGYLSHSAILTEDDFSAPLGYKLLSDAAKGRDAFAGFADCNEALSRRIFHTLPSYHGFKAFAGELKSRDITYTRAARILTHILLSVTKEDLACTRKLDYIPYLRILGFQKNAAPLLSAIKRRTHVPLLSKLADAKPSAQKNILSPDAFCVLEKDIFAADLYTQVRSVKTGVPSRSEYSMPIIVIK